VYVTLHEKVQEQILYLCNCCARFILHTAFSMARMHTMDFSILKATSCSLISVKSMHQIHMPCHRGQVYLNMRTNQC